MLRASLRSCLRTCLRGDGGATPPPASRGAVGAASAPGVSRWTRRTVHWFLLVFAVTGIAHLEVWPFTGFRLFSELRPSIREGWQIVAVESEGAEHGIALAELPVAYRNTTRLIPGLVDASAAAREEVCDAWATPLRDDGEDVAHLRVYAVQDSVRPDGPLPTRQLAFECGFP